MECQKYLPHHTEKWKGEQRKVIKTPSMWRSFDFLPRTKYLSMKLSELFLLIYELLHQFLLLGPCLYPLEHNSVRQLRSHLVSKLEVLTIIVWSGGSGKWKHPMHEEPNRKTSEFKSLLEECRLKFTKPFLPNTIKIGSASTLTHTGSSLAYLSPCKT